jgi:hypothetical protein
MFIFVILTIFDLFLRTIWYMPLNEIFIFPPKLFVWQPTLNNFQDPFIIMSKSWVTFSRYIFNTVFVTALGTAGLIIAAWGELHFV